MNLWDKYNSVIDILIKAKEDEKLATLRHIMNLIDEIAMTCNNIVKVNIFITSVFPCNK